MSTPLVIDTDVEQQIRDLCEFAFAQPVDMPGLAARVATPEGKAAHVQQMTRQTIRIPLAFLVTFAVETGHPCGICRHMSMSVQREGRIPNEIAAWMIAKKFGFWGGLERCAVWHENLSGHGPAINLVQPVTPR